MNIDWSKFTEITYGAVCQGVFAGMAVFIAFWLGKMDSDRKWERELKQQKKEEQIEALKAVISVMDKLRYGDLLYWRAEEIRNNQMPLFAAYTLFKGDDKKIEKIIESYILPRDQIYLGSSEDILRDFLQDQSILEANKALSEKLISLEKGVAK
jgi:hypothetical protein